MYERIRKRPIPKSTKQIVAMYFILAQTAPTTSPEWWQIAAGIIAIPTGIIGMVYSWFLVQKTRLETAKLAAEIAEKAKAAQTATTTSLEAGVTHEAIVQATVPLLLLRYVLLQLLWTLWGYASKAITLVFEGIGFGVYTLAHHKGSLLQGWMVAPFFVLENLTWIGEIFIFMAVGWPLFKDLNKIFNVNTQKIFFWWRHK